MKFKIEAKCAFCDDSIDSDHIITSWMDYIKIVPCETCIEKRAIELLERAISLKKEIKVKEKPKSRLQKKKSSIKSK